MTLATAMMFPSSFLQNCYVALVEYEKGSDLWEPLPRQPARASFVEEDTPDGILTIPETRGQPFELAVRVTSLAHAALQFVCAAIETVPLLAVTTVTVLFNASNSGFFYRNGGRLERVASAALVALASVWLPVGTSLWAVLNPSDLNDEDSLTQYQMKAQTLLLSFTLPSLPRLADRLGHDTRENLEDFLRRAAAARGHVVAAEEGTAAGKESDLLEWADAEFFRWRTNLADRLAIKVRDNPAYLSELDLLSVAFELRMAVRETERNAQASPDSTEY